MKVDCNKSTCKIVEPIHNGYMYKTISTSKVQRISLGVVGIKITRVRK